MGSYAKTTMKQNCVQLSSNTFKINIVSNFRNLFIESNYSDVTLVSDDMKQFQAHKIVLSAFSPVLKNMLHNNPHPNPLIYLRGLKQKELKSILHILYLGEVLVSRDSISEFMEVAKDLELNGFTQESLKYDSFTFVSEYNVEEPLQHSSNDIKIEITREDILDSIKLTSNLGNGECLSENLLYKCEECEAVFKSKLGMKMHIRGKHEGVVFSCNNCDYQTSVQGNLKTHQQSVHEGLKYSCDSCDYQATRPDSLKNHQQSKHTAVRYACDQCKHQTAWKQELKYHKQRRHPLKGNMGGKLHQRRMERGFH